jgi:hypothetical protein
MINKCRHWIIRLEPLLAFISKLFCES